MTRFFSIFAYCLQIIPETVVQVACWFFGNCLYYGLRSRRKILLRNLFTAFPDKTEKWRKSIAKLNCSRWVETVWLFLISWQWPKQRVLRKISISPSLKNWIEEQNRNPKSSIVLIPHLNLMETMTWIPCFFDKFPETGVVYRPFRTKWFENWIRSTRERFGIQLISRKRGVLPLEKILKSNGLVGILFDQSAGETGVLTTFMGRLASCTDLAGRLVEKYQTDVVAIYLKRIGFLRGELCIDEISCPKTAMAVTFKANEWLEKKLKKESSFFENWLWLHNRWKIQYWPLRRFNISQKRNWLEETCSHYQLKSLPAKTFVWIRLPNWLGDCIMAYPLIKAIRQARPDFQIHILVRRAFATFIQKHFPVDFIHTLPEKKGISYFKSFFKIRERYPDVWINFPNSLRSDIEAFCSGAPQRFGLQKQGMRPLLNYTFKTKLLPEEHQTELWYRFFKNFGLKIPLSREACFQKKCTKQIKLFVCFCGSSNTKAKRWPVKYWQECIQSLLQQYPKSRCCLLGTEKEQMLCAQILAKLPSDCVQNLAGKTNFSNLEQILLSSDLAIANDSGGMHLCNFLGVPTVGLFGPTKVSYTGMYYDAPKCVLTSPSDAMKDLQPDYVFQKIVEWIESVGL